MVVKIQRSIFASDGNSTMMIYDRSRDIYKIQPLTPEIKNKLGISFKGYFMAKTGKDGVLEIGMRVPDQDW